MKSKKLILIASIALLFTACALASESDRKMRRVGEQHKLKESKSLGFDWISLHEGHWGRAAERQILKRPIYIFLYVFLR